MKNIEQFDLYVGKTLAKLYENFPLKLDLDICELVGVELDRNAVDVPRECHICFDSIEWLYESGYISREYTDAPLGVYRTVLSARGLELLKSTPKSLTPKDGIGEQIRDLVRQGKDQALRQSVNLVLSQGARMFAKGGI